VSGFGPLDFDGHCELHRNREVTCIDCGAVFVCLPASDYWHCPACFDGTCNGRCERCHAQHRRLVHADNVRFSVARG